MYWFGHLSMITAVVAIIVILAMSIDLASGLYKASLRGEKKSSYGLQRTTMKTIVYIGSVFICYGIDVLAHLGKFWTVIGWEWMMGIPAFAILIGIFNCIVELVSVREKASEKADKHTMKKLLSLVKELRQSEVVELAEAIKGLAEKKGSG